MIHGMSIRFRLTLLYSTVLVLTLIAFSTILYLTQTRATYDSIKANLMRQVAGFARADGRFPGPPPAPPEGALLPEASPLGVPSDLNLPSGTLPGRWTQTRSITGTVTGRTLDLTDAAFPLSQRGLQTVQSGTGWYETAQVQDQPLLIYSQLFTPQNGDTEIVQVAFPIAQSQQSLNALRLMLVAGSSVAILAAFAVGWVLAGAVLRPIQDITRTARAIGTEHDFGRRVQHSGPADEVGQLAITFNGMLAELESAYRQLEDALDSQRRFVADASHELRTPLTTVRGNVELLRRESPMDLQERTEILADTTDEVDRLIRLVSQLLTLARADTGQTLHCEPVPLKPLLEDVCRQAQLLAPETTVGCEPPRDVAVLADRDALKQVLLILLDNAHVHTAPGTVVEVRTGCTERGVVISVRDAGPGITPDVLPHIFERFFRANVSRSGPGAGLGLAIAKELVEAQNGTIAVESEVGRGSTFTVVLPQA